MIEISNFITPAYLFLLILFPILGFAIPKFEDKIIKITTIISLLLLVSRLTGYIIITDWLYVACGLFILSLTYYYSTKSFNQFYVKIVSFILIILLFLFSFVVTFLNGFGGVHEKTGASDRYGRYKVETVVLSGFSGRSVTKHKLYYYPIWFFVYKNVETISIDPFNETQECVVSFKTYPIVYDSCLNEIQ